MSGNTRFERETLKKSQKGSTNGLPVLYLTYYQYYQDLKTCLASVWRTNFTSLYVTLIFVKIGPSWIDRLERTAYESFKFCLTSFLDLCKYEVTSFLARLYFFKFCVVLFLLHFLRKAISLSHIFAYWTVHPRQIIWSYCDVLYSIL